MLNLTDSSIVTATQSQVSADLAGETAILNLSDGVYYGLDAVGSRIWTLIQQPIRIHELQDVLVSEYDVEPERCLEDLYTLLGELHKHGLIEVSNEQAV
jgi:hypothetical protein